MAFGKYKVWQRILDSANSERSKVIFQQSYNAQVGQQTLYSAAKK